MSSAVGDKDVETIGLGLDGLEKLFKREMKIEQLTDLQAKVHFIKKRLDELEAAGANRVKTYLLDEDKSIVEGHSWAIQNNPVKVFRLDTTKVKAFFGKQLKKYGTTNTENRLKYISRGR